MLCFDRTSKGSNQRFLLLREPFWLHLRKRVKSARKTGKRRGASMGGYGHFCAKRRKLSFTTQLARGAKAPLRTPEDASPSPEPCPTLPCGKMSDIRGQLRTDIGTTPHVRPFITAGYIRSAADSLAADRPNGRPAVRWKHGVPPTTLRHGSGQRVP